MTALIHLGYLGYDREEESAFIPNYEVKKDIRQPCAQEIGGKLENQLPDAMNC